MSDKFRDRYRIIGRAQRVRLELTGKLRTPLHSRGCLEALQLSKPPKPYYLTNW